MKKFLALMTALLMILASLTACNGDGESGSQTSGVNDNTSGSSAVGDGLSGTLNFVFHVSNPETDEIAFYNALQGFKAKYPGVTVNYVGGTSPEEHVNKMKLAATDGSLPDIFWCLDPAARELASAGHLMDLRDFLNAYPDIEAALPNSMEDACTQDGILYGLPYQVLVTGFWYNKAVFQANQVEPPTEGMTFEDLLDAVAVFRSNGVTTIINGAKSPFSVWSFLIAWERFGFSEKIDAILAGEEKFNNPDFLRYFEKIDQLRQAGAFAPNIATNDYGTACALFEAGEAAILDAGQWEANTTTTQALGEDIGFWWGPTFSDGVGNQEVCMKVPAAPLCVSADVAKDENRKALVYAFFEYYYGQESAELQIEADTVPVQDVDLSSVDVSDRPAFQAILEALNKDWISPEVQPDMTVSAAVQNVMYDSLYGVMVGTYTPEQALQNIDDVMSAEQ